MFAKLFRLLIIIVVIVVLSGISLYTIAAKTGQPNLAPFVPSIMFAREEMNAGQPGAWHYELYQEPGSNASLDIRLATYTPSLQDIEAFKKINDTYLVKIQQQFQNDRSHIVEVMAIFNHPIAQKRFEELAQKYDFIIYQSQIRIIDQEGDRATGGGSQFIQWAEEENYNVLGVFQALIRIPIDQLEPLRSEPELFAIDMTPTIARLDFQEKNPIAFQNLYKSNLQRGKSYVDNESAHAQIPELDYVQVMPAVSVYWALEELTMMTLPAPYNFQGEEIKETGQLRLSWDDNATSESKIKYHLFCLLDSPPAGYVGTTEDKNFVVEKPEDGCLYHVESWNLAGYRSPTSATYQFGSPTAVALQGNRAMNKQLLWGATAILAIVLTLIFVSVMMVLKRSLFSKIV